MIDFTKANKKQLLQIALSEYCPNDFKFRAISELEERKKRKTRTYEEDGLEYTASNHRLRYNPEFHENHGKPFTVKELAYLCSSWESMNKSDIAMALGRTHGTVLNKACLLKKNGQFERFEKIGRAGI